MTALVLRPLVFLISLLCALASTASTSVPWPNAEALRNDSAYLQRYLFRQPSTPLREDASKRLEHLRQQWQQGLQAAYAHDTARQAAQIDNALARLEQAVQSWDPGLAAQARAELWCGLLDGALRNSMRQLDQGAFESAAAWLHIREYARTSRDTAASLAIREALAGRLSAAQARQIIEPELLGIYASEMRMALAQARSHLAAGHRVQLAGSLARAQGLQRLLTDNLSSRLGSEKAQLIAARFTQLHAERPADALAKQLAELEGQLSSYAPAQLAAAELQRRIQLFSRFLRLIPIEYSKGVRDGEVTIPFEYFEAGLFRDRAEMLLGDLGYNLAERAPAALQRMTDILSELQQQIASKGAVPRVQALSDEGLALLAQVYGQELLQSDHGAALTLLPEVLSELANAVSSGDWAAAELKRLEAYALFDPDIEQRLMPRAPALALKMEAAFWEGNANDPGLGALIARQAPAEELNAALARLQADSKQAASILSSQLSAMGAFIQSLAILLREGLEAVIVLACMIGAVKASGIPAAGLRGWRWPILAGTGSAVAGSFALWLAVGQLFAMTTLQRELLEGLTALTAAAVLLYVTHWIFRKAYVTDWVAEIRRKASHAGQSQQGSRSPYLGWTTLFSLAFLVVFREGFETVLFYQALLIDAPSLPVLAGLIGGALLSAVAAYVVLGLEAKLPVTLFFRVTGVLLAMLCLMMTGSGVRGLQTAALVPATPVHWFPDAPWLQLYFGLYPVAETLLAQGLLAALLLLSLALLLYRRPAGGTPGQSQAA